MNESTATSASLKLYESLIISEIKILRHVHEDAYARVQMKTGEFKDGYGKYGQN